MEPLYSYTPKNKVRSKSYKSIKPKNTQKLLPNSHAHFPIHEKNNKFYFSDCLSTTEDSSLSLMNINHIDDLDELVPKLENEDILITISKKQRKLSNYSNDDNIAFPSRESIINWIERVLESVGLQNNEKESIFHRFTACFDLVMDKLYLNKSSIHSEYELKKMTITIFLLTYKFEGLVLGKLTIKTLIDAFFSSMNINSEELENTIMKTELKILSLLDYNPFCFEDNIYELSLILFDLLKKKFNLSENVIQFIKVYLNESNKNVLIDNKILFDLVPIDKASISIISIIIFIKKYIEDGYDDESVQNQLMYYELENLDFSFFKYLKNELKVLKLTNWLQFKKKCLFFANKMLN